MKEKGAFYRLKYYLDLNGISYTEIEPNKTIECKDVTIMEGIYDPDNLTISYYDDDLYIEEKTVVEIVDFLKEIKNK